MMNAECKMRNAEWGSGSRRYSAFIIHHSAFGLHSALDSSATAEHRRQSLRASPAAPGVVDTRIAVPV
jgi:hypothetical protein